MLRIAVWGFFTDKWDPMFNLTDLLDQLGAHFSLVVIACIELLAAALLVARAFRSEDNRPVGGRRSAMGKAGENGADMLRALNFRRFEANLLLRRADMMPLYAVGDLAGLLGLPLESLQEDLAAVLPNMADGEAARSLWKTYQHWDGTAPLHREMLRAHGIPARYAEGYYLSADASAPGTVTLTGKDAHAWAEVYFDGVGWLPLDTTPSHYFEAVALQQMVGLPNAVRKTAALRENNIDAAQITGSGTMEGDTGLLPEALKDTTLALLGIAALLLLALALLVAAAELWRAVRIRRVEHAYRRADPMRRAGMIEHQLFALLQAEEIDSTLGYETKAVDARVAEKFEKVKPGEFARTCALLERCVYGGQAPDAREERALSSFLWKLIRSRPKHTLLQNLKRRYRRI